MARDRISYGSSTGPRGSTVQELHPELRKRMHREVELAYHCSSWPANRTLATHGVPARNFTTFD